MPNRLLAFTRFALAVAERVLPERAHRFAPRRYTQPQLFAYRLLKEYLQLDYRSTEELIDTSDGIRPPDTSCYVITPRPLRSIEQAAVHDPAQIGGSIGAGTCLTSIHSPW